MNNPSPQLTHAIAARGLRHWKNKGFERERGFLEDRPDDEKEHRRQEGPGRSRLPSPRFYCKLESEHLVSLTKYLILNGGFHMTFV